MLVWDFGYALDFGILFFIFDLDFGLVFVCAFCFKNLVFDVGCSMFVLLDLRLLKVLVWIVRFSILGSWNFEILDLSVLDLSIWDF